MPLGIIIKGIGGFYYVKTSDTVYECKARGIFRKDDITPLTGDKVEIHILDEEKKKGSLDKVLERESELLRPAVANVNQIALVVTPRSPSPDLLLLDKLLIAAQVKNVKPVICINKLDLDEEGQSEAMQSAYEKAGYGIVKLSSVYNVGYEDLYYHLSERITAFAGQSGVGKSTILNKIMDSMVMQTGSISGKIERGKHTTRHAELLELDCGGFVVDTPGFSSFELLDMKQGDLEFYYPEFREHIGSCRFKGCSHISEPDCAVKDMLDQGKIDRGRYERYIEIYNSLKNNNKDYFKNKKRN